MQRDRIGCSVQDLDTPCLTVDLDAMEANIRKTAEALSQLGVQWRPHIKGIKVPAIVHRLLDAGAIGMTCATLSEAEGMVAAGVRRILIANQIVGPAKTRRLAALNRSAEVLAAVDSLENIQELDRAARNAGVQIPLVVEIDLGMQRCGVPPGAAVVRLAQTIHNALGLRFLGLMGWEGHVREEKDPNRREELTRHAVKALIASAEACRQAGLPVEIVSCGGTGTETFSGSVPGVTEVQAGGIVFHDLFYAGLGVQRDFALTVQSTVISRPSSNRIVTDAGRKSCSVDHGPPLPRIDVEIVSVRLSAEHGTIFTREPSTLRVGDKVEWIVGYADTTVHLHDQLYGIRGRQVESIWSIHR